MKEQVDDVSHAKRTKGNKEEKKPRNTQVNDMS